ncbi:MAG: TRAP transporter small permease subunit [Rhodopseudomonas sp.]|nr:TRAP transporter small permease subunit [Rhodopseudomonas sp.]
MNVLSRALSRLAYGLALLAGAALLYMMMLTVTDIVGRSFGLFTINSGIEQSELLMVVVCFFGLARCVQLEGHIVVDVATGHLPDRVNRLIDAFWHLVMAAVVALLGYLVMSNGIALDRTGSATELLHLTPLIGHSIAAIGLGVTMVLALSLALDGIRRGGRAADPQK